MKRKKQKRHRKGEVAVCDDRGNLRLVFSFHKQRFFWSLRLPDTPHNRLIAHQKALKIRQDIELGLFRPENKSLYITNERPEGQTVRLAELWQRFVDYQKQILSPTTIVNSYEAVTRYLAKCSTEGLQDPVSLRGELLQITTKGQAQDALMYLSKCCQWGIKHGLLDRNPFAGMYREIKTNKPTAPVAFTREERDQIIAAFVNHSTYSHYAPLVKFLFWTGCRPCEAVGLKWSAVALDCSFVQFAASIVIAGSKLIERQSTKTGVVRKFPCNQALQELLQSLDRSTNPLVFPSKRGKPINIRNFNVGAWRGVLASLGLDYKNGIRMTPYNCRDTFISLQIAAGVSSDVVAYWVGNSPAVIRQKYLDPAALDRLAPVLG
ncbi:MAG: tyrosine-type recombinase/integrase [Pseudanabaenaceae cyanobacterium SKYGB_i_bin29]|nr:tyrosine-type recombinase/integrase [Pseudanabaenaceae cyanobacterium SKYG29]MDW8420908.1 tyrosine-type recombinase/integrase [Pseudanabaenaceae cyanobacterium SKYGB_i_bin29]